jgi:hypothetical protein
MFGNLPSMAAPGKPPFDGNYMANFVPIIAIACAAIIGLILSLIVPARDP